MKTPIKVGELDVVGRLFGLKFVEGGSNGLVELYIEDDENYHYKCSFDRYWLTDLTNVVNEALDKVRVV